MMHFRPIRSVEEAMVALAPFDPVIARALEDRRRAQQGHLKPKRPRQVTAQVRVLARQRRREIGALLLKAPASAMKLSVELGCETTYASTLLGSMRRSGLTEPQRRVEGSKAFIWTLTPRGRREFGAENEQDQ